MGKKPKDSKATPMEELTKGYEDFIKRQALKQDGKQQFEKAIKKASKPKPRSSK
jgi:hypothetical protein